MTHSGVLLQILYFKHVLHPNLLYIFFTVHISFCWTKKKYISERKIHTNTHFNTEILEKICFQKSYPFFLYINYLLVKKISVYWNQSFMLFMFLILLLFIIFPTNALLSFLISPHAYRTHRHNYHRHKHRYWHNHQYRQHGLWISLGRRIAHHFFAVFRAPRDGIWGWERFLYGIHRFSVKMCPEHIKTEESS